MKNVGELGSALGARYARVARPLLLPLALVIFTASGFSGLIYESIWSHYLKLFLGHAAYAQTLVLAIFMGGMAGGAWLASRVSPRWRDLLVAYAVVEAVIGVLSLVFHDTFIAVTAFAFDTALPAIGTPAAIQAFKWALAAALILPQSVLLGMTFPLMTGGVLRLCPERAGYAIAMLYFTNSLGAAAGVLASGFYFIPFIGLPGTLAAAGVVNLAVAAAVMLLPRSTPAPAPVVQRGPAAQAAVPLGRLLLAVAALTGVASFMYEIAWIRMLTLVLGASTHAFELMLSAFIFGIACGGLWIRRRVDAAQETVRLLGWVQVVMGLAALATLPVYGSTFFLMQQAVTALTPTDSGYAAFNVVSHALALAVMFPAAFCAGMTLPLITASLLRRGAGERAIGQVYAANTAGAILGVIIAVHLGFTLLGLKGLVVAGAALDLALGVILIAVAGSRARAYALGAGGIAAAALAVALFGVTLNAHDMSSGVYRLGRLLEQGKIQVLLQADGKTSTVSVTDNFGVRALRTNGKSDGAVRFGEGPVSHDEVMMTLAGALPQFLAPGARHIANIGFGTGMTTHVLLASDAVERVDTIEIEPAMVRAGAHFRPRNARALDDPRSRVHFDDAKTFFASRQARYDVIVSEPSNPWVSGVAGLFSEEFYRDVRAYLRDGGLLIQWIQLYEMSPALVATIITALDGKFTDYELWFASQGDMLVVAAHNGRVPRPDGSALKNPRLLAELERFNIRNLDDLLLHRVAGRSAMAPYFAAFGVQANSDFYPVLDSGASRARFLRSDATEIAILQHAGFPLLEMFDNGPQPDPARLSPGERPWLLRSEHALHARSAATYLRSGDRAALEGLPREFSTRLTLLRASLVDCALRPAPSATHAALADLAVLVNQHLAPPEAQSVWRQLEASPCQRKFADTERNLLRLHSAISRRAPEDIANAAGTLLMSRERLEPETVSRVLATYMAAQLVARNATAARLAFRDFRGALSDSPMSKGVLRFLLGHADNPVQP